MAIRSEQLHSDKLGPEKSGPEKYAPNWRGSEKPSDADRAAADASTGEIRDFVLRNVEQLHRQRNDVNAAADPAAESVNKRIHQIAGASIEEIDQVILKLESLREMLCGEGDRLNREIAGYASLSHASMTAMKIIGDGLKQWIK